MSKPILKVMALIMLLTNALFGLNITTIAQDLPPPQLNYSQTGDEITVTIKLYNYKLRTVRTPEGETTQIVFKDAARHLEKGAPNVPKFSKSVIVPNKGNTSIEIIETTFDEYENIVILPSKGNLYRNIDPATVPLIFGKPYTENAYFPTTAAALQKPYIFRNYRGQTIDFNLVQYNPVLKKLRIYKSIKVKISTDNSKGVNEITRKNTPSVSKEIQAIYEKQYINYQKNTKYEPISEQGNMLIVAHGAYMAAMQDFVGWKQQKGMQVDMVNVADIGDKNAIKAYISDKYFNDGLRYVLLVGDAEHIPSLNKSGDSDAAYGHVDGEDSYAEVFVGRFSGQSIADIETQAQRVIDYEKYPQNDDWYAKHTLIASSEGGNGQGDDGETDYEHMQNIRPDLMNFTYTQGDELYDGTQGGEDAAGNPSAADLANVLNEGRSMIAYVGHGSDVSFVTTGFSVNDVNNLTNDNKLPFIFDVACVNGNFHGQTCFAESWMRAQNNNAPTGAIAIIASTINQSWDPPMAGQDEMVDILTESYQSNVKRTFAGITINGCMRMNDKYGAAGYEMTDTWTIFGDPSLVVRTAQPQEILAQYTNTLLIGQNKLEVRSDAENAVVTLMRQNEILANAVVTDGKALLSGFVLDQVGDLNITITGFNKIPHLSTINVIPPNGPYVGLKEFSIADQNGNNNQLADFMENFGLNIHLENFGIENAENITLRLYSEDPHITLNQNLGEISIIEQGTSILLENQFNLSIDETIADGHLIPMMLYITDNQNNLWESSFTIKAHAPKLQMQFVSFTNADQNPVSLTAGLNALANFRIVNKGSAASPALSLGTQPDVNENLYWVNNVRDLSTILPGDTATLSFEFNTAANLNQGDIINIAAILQTHYKPYYLSISFISGNTTEDWESNSFDSFAWTNNSGSPWTISKSAFEGSFAAKSGTIGNSQNTELGISLTIPIADTLRFMCKVSTEADYDYLHFIVNGSTIHKWSGEMDWEQISVELPAGNNQISWKYIKDSGVVAGDDCVYIDNIVFPPTSLENLEPQIVSEPILVVEPAVAYQYNIVATDDGNNLQISAYKLPDWLTFADNGDGTATLSGNPTLNNLGKFPVEIEVTDFNTVVTQSFTIHVSRAPEFLSTPVATATEEELYVYEIEASDPDPGTKLKFEILSDTKWLSLESTGDLSAKLSGTPDDPQVGQSTIIIGISDGAYNVEQSYLLTVTNINDVPQFNSTPITEIDEDKAYVYVVTFSDDDADAELSIEASLPSWLQMTNSGTNEAKISGTPTVAEIGTHSISITVSDGIAPAVIQAFELHVIEVNDKPYFTSECVAEVNQDEAYLYEITAEDEESQSELVISCPEKPNWLTFADNGSGNAQLAGTPTAENIGLSRIKISVTDGTNTTTQDFYLTVNKVNQAPEVVSTPVDTAYTGQSYSYLVEVSDANNDKISFTANNLPAWLTSTEPENGQLLLSGMPAESDTGTHTVSIEISDNDAAPITHNYTLTVISTTGITKNGFQNINIYPNPAQEYIRIEIAESAVESVQIFGSNGQLVLENKNAQQNSVITISTKDLKNGLYFIQINGGQTVSNHKIIIKK